MGQTKSRLNEEAIVLKQEKNTRAFGAVGLCETKGTRRPLIACEAKYSKKEPQFYIDLKHPNLVSPLVYDAHFKEFLGLDAQGVTFYFEYLDVSLEDIILSRKIRNSIFPEQEILNVGLAVLSTLLFLKEFDIEGGNIEPATVFYDKGQIKIYINQLILGRLAGYQMIVSQFQRLPLPSPEVLYATKKREVELVDKYRYETDIFTLGLTLLEMATLEKSSDLFNIEIRQVNVKKLDQRYALIKQRYSDRLVNLIKQMLTMDPRQRPSCESLITQVRSGVISGPANPVQKSFAGRSFSMQRSASGGSLNQSFLNASQISGIKTSNLYTRPIVVSNSRIASVERRGSLTATNVLVTPTGSRLIQGVSATVPTEHIPTQQAPVESGDAQISQTEQANEPAQRQVDTKENSIKSIPVSQQVQTEANVRHQKSITSRPQILTQNVPQNYLPNSRLPSQSYLTPQTVRYVQAPPFQGNVPQRNVLSSPQQYFSVQPQIPQHHSFQQVPQPHSNQQPHYHSVQQQLPPPPPSIQQPPMPNNTQAVPQQFVSQRLQYASSTQNLQSYPPQPHQVPYRQVISQPYNVSGRQQFGGAIQYSQVPISYNPRGYPQGQPPFQQQPVISSPQIQRNQINNLLQNHQAQTNSIAPSLNQKVQELDERVSKQIANSVKVSKQHYSDDKQDGIADDV